MSRSAKPLSYLLALFITVIIPAAASAAGFFSLNRQHESAGTDGPATAMPEPSALLVFAAGALVVGAAIKRARKTD